MCNSKVYLECSYFTYKYRNNLDFTILKDEFLGFKSIATTTGGTRCVTVNLFNEDKGIKVITDPPTSGALPSGPFSFDPLSENPKIMYELSSVRTVVNLDASAENVGQLLARISNKGEVKEYQKDSSKGVSLLICNSNCP